MPQNTHPPERTVEHVLVRATPALMPALGGPISKRNGMTGGQTNPPDESMRGMRQPAARNEPSK